MYHTVLKKIKFEVFPFDYIIKFVTFWPHTFLERFNEIHCYIYLKDTGEQNFFNLAKLPLEKLNGIHAKIENNSLRHLKK
jgi:hypothetical protein